MIAGLHRLAGERGVRRPVPDQVPPSAMGCWCLECHGGECYETIQRDRDAALRACDDKSPAHYGRRCHGLGLIQPDLVGFGRISLP
jgi:hypothetical protein